MIPVQLAAGRPLDVLAIGAHADDIEIGAGGLLLELLRAGRLGRVDWLVLSATGVRSDEAASSAHGLLDGADLHVEIRSFRERYFHYQPEIKEAFDELGRRAHPDLVLTPRLEDRHQDHRVTAELAWQTFRDHLILEYEVVKYEGDLGSPNVFMPLAADIVERKLAHLMRAFPSQHSQPWFDPAAFSAILRLRGVEASAPSGYAEGFTARKLVLA